MSLSKEIITRNDALKKISKSTIYGNLGLFIGAGMSMAILNNDWNKIALSWKELIYKCAEEFGINITLEISTEGISFPEIASEIAKLISKNENIEYTIAVTKLKEKISNLTCWYPETTKEKYTVVY